MSDLGAGIPIGMSIGIGAGIGIGKKPGKKRLQKKSINFLQTMRFGLENRMAIICPWMSLLKILESQTSPKATKRK
jgi:hypothetical protein